MGRFITGRQPGYGAIKQLGKDMRFKNVMQGKLPHINKKEREEIIKVATKVFAKNGKDPYKIDRGRFEAEVLRPLAIGRYDRLDPKEIAEFGKEFDLIGRTSRVGRKYFDIVKKEQREKFKKEVLASKETQKILGRRGKFKTAEEITAFHKRLDESIEVRKKMLLPPELRAKEENGKTKMNRADTETIPENIGQKMASDKDKNKTGLKSGGKDRIKKDNPASNIPAKKESNAIRQPRPLMTYRKTPSVVPAPIRNEIPDDALPKFNSVTSDKKLNFNAPDFDTPGESSYSQNIAEKLALAREAYGVDPTEIADTVNEKSIDNDSELDGQENDSFGLNDQKYA